MDERLQLLAAYQRREVSMAELCRRFGGSRKTGYTWVARYAAGGPAALVERSRAPHTHPHAISAAVATQLLDLRAGHPRWGPRKLVAALADQQPATAWPAASTVGDRLRRQGLSVPRQTRRHAPARTQPLAHASVSNAVWCADFKGDFRTGDGVVCKPLTITDAATRYLLRCHARTDTDTPHVQPLFEATFRQYGLPMVLRTDNGPPVASTGLGGLTPLSVWWVKLGIVPERITPGTPQENGRHERFHRTLNEDALAPPAARVRAQQRVFDAFRATYNHDRPHEALGQTPPDRHYTASPRAFPRRLTEPSYPDTYDVRRVRQNGQLRCGRAWLYLSKTLAGEPVGLRPIADGRFQLYFGPVLLGRLDERTHTMHPPTMPRHPRKDAP